MRPQNSTLSLSPNGGSDPSLYPPSPSLSLSPPVLPSPPAVATAVVQAVSVEVSSLDDVDLSALKDEAVAVLSQVDPSTEVSITTEVNVVVEAVYSIGGLDESSFASSKAELECAYAVSIGVACYDVNASIGSTKRLRQLLQSALLVSFAVTLPEESVSVAKDVLSRGDVSAQLATEITGLSVEQVEAPSPKILIVNSIAFTSGSDDAVGGPIEGGRLDEYVTTIVNIVSDICEACGEVEVAQPVVENRLQAPGPPRTKKLPPPILDAAASAAASSNAEDAIGFTPLAGTLHDISPAPALVEIVPPPSFPPPRQEEEEGPPSQKGEKGSQGSPSDGDGGTPSASGGSNVAPIAGGAAALLAIACAVAFLGLRRRRMRQRQLDYSASESEDVVDEAEDGRSCGALAAQPALDEVTIRVDDAAATEPAGDGSGFPLQGVFQGLLRRASSLVPIRRRRSGGELSRSRQRSLVYLKGTADLGASALVEDDGAHQRHVGRSHSLILAAEESENGRDVYFDAPS